ncbi:MAG: beta-ketoacyl-[acyl-carrier-protein] synthase family protein, partial [Candidatus Omnitrophica bacterium]|nr:beta-ketoacyl-[acyl-carrier-protein] synthase family protein [Candidatus Omnitrophota bacterium]
TACSSGNYAISMAFDQIKSGKQDCAVVGGADGFSRIVFTGFGRLYSVAPEKCQPFDVNRQGMIPGEGAGVLVLESLEYAVKRGAKIYAEILGYGISCDAYHIIEPSSVGISKAIECALRMTDIEKKSVDYICAHGTGTIENDRAECLAIKRVFGPLVENIPISSIKSILGHTMGAASAIESIACCLAIQNGIIPPTINIEKQDPECDIDCVPNYSRRKKLNIILNNSQAFGGNNLCLVMKGI